jgi:VanZ family protein
MISFLAKIAFYIALITIEFLATTSTVHLEVVESMWDKANHFIAFFTLFILLSFAYKLSLLKRVLILVLFGIQIEIVQYFIPAREFSLLDIVADSIGVFIGFIFLKIGVRVGLK